MRIFLSYRRDDSGGHAGRLHDSLVARLGARNVFQDVSAIEPGVDFAQLLDSAIADSDAALVVIGPGWLSASGPGGDRRLDEPDDYVRREVTAALAAGGRVVPVLVGDAELPAAGLLPDDLRPLAQRQAVALRDATWHQDVDALVRRLEGEQVVDAAPRRRWPLVAGAVGALVVAGLVVWLSLRDDSPTGEQADETVADGESATGCPSPDGSWTSIDVAPGSSAGLDQDLGTLTVTGAAYRSDGASWTLVLDTDVENTADTVGWWHDEYKYDQVVVDQVPYGPAWCFSIVGGDQNVDLGERSLAQVGFEIPADPAGKPVALVLDGRRVVQVTDAA